MRIRAGAEVAAALAELGDAESGLDSGLVFAPKTGLTTWAEAEDELMEAFRLSQRAMIEEAPVIYVLHADAVLGRATVLDSAVADGLVGGVRALAFEGQRRNRYATVLGIDADESAEAVSSLAAAVAFMSNTRAGAGQVTMLGRTHLGAMLP